MLRILLAVLASQTGAQPVPPFDVTSTWQGVMLFEGALVPKNRWSAVWRLVLQRDGRFHLHMANHVMTEVVDEEDGTYRFDGKSLVLKGHGVAKLDDGYRKWTTEQDVNKTLRYDKGQLLMSMNDSGSVIFTRPGKRPQIPLSLKPVPLRRSEPNAIKLAKAVEVRYASLKSYADEGTVQSNGSGFQPTKARFLTRFQRRGRFRFEAERTGLGKATERNAVWSDGHKSWLYMSDPGGTEARPLANALSTISVSSGQESDLVATLLLQPEMGKHPLTRYKHLVQKHDVFWAGKKCAVIELADRPGDEVSLWIDKASLLVIKAHFTFANEDVLYTPRVNPRLTKGDFVPKVPKPVSESAGYCTKYGQTAG